MHFKKILIMITALAMISFMSVAIAEDEEKNDGLARVVLITAKDGQNKALEEAITKYHHYMAGHEGSWRYQWFSIETGPNTGKYMARSGDHNWSDFDAEHDWDKEAGAKFTSMVAPLIESSVITITRDDDEMGIWPDSMDGYRYFAVTHWDVKPGQNAAFKKGLKKIDGLLKASDWPNYYAFTYPVSGGSGNQVTLVTPRKSFADMAPKEPSFMDVMKKSMSEEDANAFLAEWGSTYSSGDNFLLRHLPEQSDYGQGK